MSELTIRKYIQNQKTNVKSSYKYKDMISTVNATSATSNIDYMSRRRMTNSPSVPSTKLENDSVFTYMANSAKLENHSDCMLGLNKSGSIGGEKYNSCLQKCRIY